MVGEEPMQQTLQECAIVGTSCKYEGTRLDRDAKRTLQRVVIGVVRCKYRELYN